MDKNFTCKIADFGVSRSLTHGYDWPNEVTLKQHHDLSYDLGTPLYSAPEILNAKEYDSKIDVYSLGIIYIELLCGFKTQHERLKIITDIKKTGLIPEEIQSKYYHEYRLIRNMLKHDPLERYSVQDVIIDVDYRKLKNLYS